jgi:tRNA-binding EMAP/Myf-like protein
MRTTTTHTHAAVTTADAAAAPAAPPAAAAAAADGASPVTAMDIRVGKILSIEQHPDADRWVRAVLCCSCS